jgi:hypothetical protein
MDPPGLFHCKLCDERGAWNKLRKHFGDPIITDKEEYAYDTVKPRVLKQAAMFCLENMFAHEEVYDYLRSTRGLTLETIEAHQIGYADGALREFLLDDGFSVADLAKAGLVKGNGSDALYNHITIPYFVSGNVVSIRGRLYSGDGPKYLTLQGHKAFLYNSDTVWEHPPELVVCEGEFDALMVEQMGYAAVGVPGVSTWQENWNNYVDAEMVHRLYICFDNDDKGIEGADKLAGKLDGRAKIITLPEMRDDDDGTPNNDVSAWVTKFGGTQEEFAQMMRHSSGGMLISVREAYEEWLQIEGNPNLVGLKFGITKLDEAIKPGLLPGQVVMTLAKTGAGKTISMLNFFHRMKRENKDASFLFFSLEQTRNEWFERARRIHKFYEPSARNEDTIAFWEQNFMMVDKNRVTEEELMACVEQYKYEMGKLPDLISIDYLGYFAGGFKGKDKYEKTSAAIMAVKSIAKEIRRPIYTPHQVSRLNKAGEEPDINSARDSGVTEETADFVFALWAPDQRPGTEQSERTGDVSMKILKSRHGGVGTKIDMLFTPKTLTMIPENDPLHYKAKDEIRLAKVGDDLETVVYRNLTGWDGTLVTNEVKAEIEKLREQGYM